MSGILIVLFAVICVAAAMPIYLTWQNAKNNKSSRFSGKFLLGSGVISVIAFILLLVVCFIPSGKSSSNTTKQEQSSSQTNKKTDTKSVPVAEMNKNLASNLANDKQSAENGDQAAAYSKVIDKVTYNKNKSANVYVNDDFLNLSDNTRKQVADGVDKLINLSIGMSGVDLTPEEGREGNYLSFYTGNNIAVGHSKLTNHQEYKWYK